MTDNIVMSGEGPSDAGYARSLAPSYGRLSIAPSYGRLSIEPSDARSIAPSYARSIAPPRYSAVFADPEDRLPSDALPTQHEFSLQSGFFKRKSLATLRIFSRPSKVARKYPLYFGGENVAGAIDLKLDSPQVINSITILLKGQIVSSFAEGGYYTFLQHTENVWNKAAGDPRESANGSERGAFNGKLSGDLQFSFSFPFPTTVDFSTLSSSKSRRQGIHFQTPQTFLEHNQTTNIEYELVLQLTHGGLRPDSKVKARVRFIPEIIPDPLPDLRRLAYDEDALLPGPEADLEGWHALPRIPISGVLHQNQDVKLDYKLHLAKPLCYTRGTVIPCYLIISSQDTRSLDHLANPKIQHIRLVRRIRYFQFPGKGVENFLQGKTSQSLEEVEVCELAVWWLPPKDVLQEPCTRRLEGEIHLAKELAPSSDFLPLSIEYSVEILPFRTATFQHSTAIDKPAAGAQPETVLLSYPITIATFKAEGPAPKPFTEPGMANSMDHLESEDESEFTGMSAAKFGMLTFALV